MIERDLGDGWKLMAYAEPGVAMWPPYLEHAQRDTTIEVNGEGDICTEMGRDRAWTYVPRAHLEALLKAVDEWTAARASTPKEGQER